MKEVLRIEHAMGVPGDNQILKDYNLSVYEGDVVYIEGHDDSGISNLINILRGREKLYGGNIYILENRLNGKAGDRELYEKLYIISDGLDLVDNLSIADNLEVISRKRFEFGLLSKKRMIKRAGERLLEEGYDIDPAKKVHELTPIEKQILSLIKAKSRGARLMAIDCRKGQYDGRLARELMKLINKYRSEGMSFLVFCERRSVFEELANRFQYVSKGRDLMERDHYENSSEILQNLPDEGDEKLIYGLYDYYGHAEQDIWGFCKEMLSKEGLPEELKDIPLPERECYRALSGGLSTVIIPRRSAYSLLDNLSIADNVIIAVRERAGRFGIGYIFNAIKRTAAEDFCKSIGISGRKTRISDLTTLQKKILSVYRYVLARPDTIILEEPMWGLDKSESDAFRAYLKGLAATGIRIVISSGSMAELKTCCRVIYKED